LQDGGNCKNFSETAALAEVCRLRMFLFYTVNSLRRTLRYVVGRWGVQHTARGLESGPPGPTNTVQHEKYSELVVRLIDDFQQRFEDFRNTH